MKTDIPRATLACVLLALGGFGRAQPPTITPKWAVPTIGLGTERSIPVSCDPASIAASDTWNSVGANFFFVFNSASYHARIASQPLDFNRSNITIEDGVMVNANAIMEANTELFSSGDIANVDIIVDRLRINTTTPDPGSSLLSCSSSSTVPSNMVDWETTLLHELGHAVGFAHTKTERTCSMFEGIARGENRRALCELEKQEYIRKYNARARIARIAGIPNVTGPQFVNIPAQVFYDGTLRFPVRRSTKIVQCASGWSCSDYDGDYSSSTQSPLGFNFKCDPSEPLPTATFQWRTTLIDANGAVTNAVDHTSTCTMPASSPSGAGKERSPGINRVIVTN